MIDIGRFGIWQSALNDYPSSVVRETVAELDEAGWPTMWIPETVSRDPFVAAAVMLEATTNMKVATGIASIWARDAMTTSNASLTLNEAYDGRFLLGLGVSHHTLVNWVRKHDYSKPYSFMAEYLEFMENSLWRASVGSPELPGNAVLAALGPKMLALAADKTAGAHPYFTTPDHTATAREVMGPDALLAPEQMCVLSTDAAEARAVARKNMAVYLALPNYANNLKRLGFTDDDLADGASDRLVDAIVVWGDDATIAARVAEHHAAGADHVCVQVLTDDPRDAAAVREGWRHLAPALLGGS